MVTEVECVVDSQEKPPPNLTAMSILEVYANEMKTDHIHIAGWKNLD